MKNWKLGTKLGIGFGVLLIFTIVVGLGGLFAQDVSEGITDNCQRMRHSGALEEGQILRPVEGEPFADSPVNDRHADEKGKKETDGREG